MNGLMNRLSDATKDSVVRSIKTIFDANSLTVVSTHTLFTFYRITSYHIIYFLSFFLFICPSFLFFAVLTLFIMFDFYILIFFIYVVTVNGPFICIFFLPIIFTLFIFIFIFLLIIIIFIIMFRNIYIFVVLS